MCDGNKSNTEDSQGEWAGAGAVLRCSFRSDAACESSPSSNLTQQHTTPADGCLTQQCVYFLKVRSYAYDVSCSLITVTRDLERTIPKRKGIFWAAGRWRVGSTVSGKSWWKEHDKLVRLGQHHEQLLKAVLR